MNEELKVADKKQSRLPFKVLDVTKTSCPVQLKKRKLSENETPTTPSKVSKKEEENIDIANLGTSLNKSLIERKTLETTKVPNDTNNVTVDSEVETEIKSNSDKDSANQLAELSSSDDDNEEEEKKESEIEFSRTETSEMDASLIFEQGSLLGESTGNCPPSGKKKKRQSPMNPKKLEEMERRKLEKLRLRAEREKQLQEARDLKKKQKEDEKLERDRKKLEEKQKKLQELEEKRVKDQKDREEKSRIKQEKKEKEEQERLEKLKAKEEEKQKKLQLINEKQDEKKRKEEERIKKLEEKKKAEEEEERKKLKEKAVFKKFFIKNETSPPQHSMPVGEDCNGIFKPFEVTKNMTVASVVPDVASHLFKKDHFEIAFRKQEATRLYVEELKAGQRIPLFKKMCVRNRENDINKKEEEEDEEVIVLSENQRDDHPKEKHRAKLFQFSENVRPPYYGTWMKYSNAVKGRKPFARDTAFFDYEVDSDEEWEEGGPGESLSGSDDEKESEDDYEVDNEFFVPHGYLSADEEKDDELGDSPEHLQKRLKMRQLEFQEELKKKCSEMKPVIVGCLWIGEEHLKEKIYSERLRANAAVLLVPLPIVTSLDSLNVEDRGTGTPNSSANHTPDAKKKKFKKFPPEAMDDFIKLIHCNTNGRSFLLNEFQEFWLQKTQEEKVIDNPEETEEKRLEATPNSEKIKIPENSPNAKISKRQLEITFNKIASWIRCPDPALNRICWWVREETRKEYDCLVLPIPNQWNYLTRKDPEPSPASAQKKTDDKTPGIGYSGSSTPSIRKFATVTSVPRLTLTPDSKKKAVKINLNAIQSQLPNETKATLSDISKLMVTKTPRRIVPTTLKNRVMSSPNKDVEVVLAQDEKKVNFSDNEMKNAEGTTSSLSNFIKPNCLTSIADSPKNKQEDVKQKSAADSTPSILKYVKRIIPAMVQNPKRPKLAEKCNEVVNLD